MRPTNIEFGWRRQFHEQACESRFGVVGDPAVAPRDQYTAISPDEAQDNFTGLIWQRTGNSSGFVSWDQANAYCKALTLGGATWRLPSVRELATLVDEAQVAPAINRTMFPQYPVRRTQQQLVLGVASAAQQHHRLVGT